jgi:pyridoxamine 5'-phosphate oxidase-like protein
METLKLELTDEIAEEIDTAYESGRPVLIAYLGDDGYPHVSFRGTAQVFGPQELAVWARNPEGGLPTAVAERPPVSLIYRNPQTRQMYVFYGRARVATDEETKRVVYERSPEREQQADPERGGVAIVIDLDRVDGIGPERRFRMERS